jgi:hypothetical protein
MMTFDSIELPIFLVTVDGAIARLNRAACEEGFDEIVSHGAPLMRASRLSSV